MHTLYRMTDMNLEEVIAI